MQLATHTRAAGVLGDFGQSGYTASKINFTIVSIDNNIARLK